MYVAMYVHLYICQKKISSIKYPISAKMISMPLVKQLFQQIAIYQAIHCIYTAIQTLLLFV